MLNHILLLDYIALLIDGNLYNFSTTKYFSTSSEAGLFQELGIARNRIQSLLRSSEVWSGRHSPLLDMEGVNC